MRWSSAPGEAIFPGSHARRSPSPWRFSRGRNGGPWMARASPGMPSSYPVLRESSQGHPEACSSSPEHSSASRRDCIRSRRRHQGNDSAKAAVRAACKNKLNIDILQFYRRRKGDPRPQMKEKRRRNRRQNSERLTYSPSHKPNDKGIKMTGKVARVRVFLLALVWIVRHYG